LTAVNFLLVGGDQSSRAGRNLSSGCASGCWREDLREVDRGQLFRSHRRPSMTV